MRGNQFVVDGRLYRFDFSADGPPWAMQVWNDDAASWESVGYRYASSSPLLRVPSKITVLSENWLLTAAGDLVLTATNDVIVMGLPFLASLPDFVLTAATDIIAVAERG